MVCCPGYFLSHHTTKGTSDKIEIHTTYINPERDKENDKSDTNSKKYETIRQLVKGGDQRQKKINTFLRYSIPMVQVIANSL
jgi:hypothetical protein